MRKLLLMALLLASLLCGLQSSSSAGQEEAGATAAPASGGTIKVTIATGGGLYGPVKNQFKLGEDIPITISMTNTGDSPARYCLSTTLIQNRPQLNWEGQPMPYLTTLPQRVDTVDAVRRCEASAFRQFYELRPKQKRVVDWLTISRRNIDWYGPLPAGRYELVLKRRIECCQGPMEESNKVTFEIVP